MPYKPRLLSEIMEQMSRTLLRNPRKAPSPEAARVALFLAKVAWNESVGIGHARNTYRSVWETLEEENPTLWNEFKWNDIEQMLDELVWFKKSRYPHDRRRILTCGMLDAKVRVESLPAVAPGVDALWEMQLYGLVQAGEHGKAMRLLRTARRISTQDAARQVAEIAAELGIG